VNDSALKSVIATARQFSVLAQIARHQEVKLFLAQLRAPNPQSTA